MSKLRDKRLKACSRASVAHQEVQQVMALLAFKPGKAGNRYKARRGRARVAPLLSLR